MVWWHSWTICITGRKKKSRFRRFWRRSTRGQTEMGRPCTELPGGDLFSPSKKKKEHLEVLATLRKSFLLPNCLWHVLPKMWKTHTHTQTHAYTGPVCARAPRHTHTQTHSCYWKVDSGTLKVKHSSVCFKAMSHSKDVNISMHPLRNRLLRNHLGEAVKPTNDAKYHSKPNKSRGEAEGASSHHGACRPGPPAVLCLRWWDIGSKIYNCRDLFLSDKVTKDAFVFQALKVLTSLTADNLPPTRVRTWPCCSAEAGWSAGGPWSERTSCSQQHTAEYLCNYL